MVDYKEIHYDTVITDFGYKDDALHIHFKPGPKLKSKFEGIDSVLDKRLEESFRKEIADTGKIIEENVSKLDSKIKYSPPEDESIKWGRAGARLDQRSIFFDPRLPQSKPEEFQRAQEAHRDLLKLYDCKDVIHKTYTGSLGGRNWEELKSWGYIVHYKTPFIDDIMLDLCKKIDEDLSKA